MNRAILFDLDGTLLDRDKSVKKFIDSQYDRLNKVLGFIPKKQYIQRLFELNNHGLREEVYKQLVNEFKFPDITWEELFDDYVENFKDHCTPFPNLMSMLEELRNRKIALGMITNGRGQFQMDKIKALGIEPYFDAILISEWEGIRKPDPEIFYRALQKLTASPDLSIFVGDHPENDIKAAQNAGMKGVWKRDSVRGNIEADAIIDDLAEIPSIIDELIKKDTEVKLRQP